MITALQAATYISQRYKKQSGQDIDEMKLHKLLYFALRESLIVQQEPMFIEQFVAWKYGPVMLCVRDALKTGPLSSSMPNEEEKYYNEIFNAVFERYAGRPSWSLSTLTHGELSWQNARVGLDPDVNGHNMMELDDIRKDAERIKMRRMLFE